MSENIDYEKEVRKVYPVKSDIDCDFYYDKIAKEELWHIDVINYKRKRMDCIGNHSCPIQAFYRVEGKTWHISVETTDAADSIDRLDGQIRDYKVTHWMELPCLPTPPSEG